MERPSRPPTPRAGWPRRTSTRESAARSTRAPPSNSPRRQPGFPARLLVLPRTARSPDGKGGTHAVAVRLAPDTRTLSAAAARAAVDADGSSRQAPAAPASRTGRRRPPRGDRPDQDRLARTTPRGTAAGSPVPDRAAPARTDRTARCLEPGPDRRPRPLRPVRTPPEAPRGRTTDRADRTVPRRHLSGRPAPARPAQRPSGKRPGCPERRTRRREWTRLGTALPA